MVLLEISITDHRQCSETNKVAAAGLPFEKIANYFYPTFLEPLQSEFAAPYLVKGH